MVRTTDNVMGAYSVRDAQYWYVACGAVLRERDPRRCIAG